MKIIVLNGSPKGKKSVTVFTPKYIAKCFPEHTWNIWDVGQTFRTYEKDPTKIKLLEEADMIVWAYPVYTFLAPSQLHRFIELVKESGVNLQGKWCTQITTSKHVYDFTAHRFIEDNATDMGMRIVPGLSADMNDLLTPEGQHTARLFWESVEYAIAHHIEAPRAMRAHRTSQVMPAVQLPQAETTDKQGKYDTLIVCDLSNTSSNLGEMIRYFRQVYKYQTRVIDISQYPFKSGCIGCLRCASSEKCVFKDGFDHYLRTEILNADTIIYAFEVKDHSMGYHFKRYQDRNFCNGHRTTTMGKPIGFLVSGALSGEDNLKTYLNAYAQVGHNYLSYIASDEYDPKAEVEHLAQMTEYALTSGIHLPQNFLGLGGHKVFRDLIYEMRGMMRADHKFYKKKGFYDDFPQRRWKKSLFMKLIGFMMKSPKMMNKMNDYIILPYEKVLDEVALKKE